MHSPHKVLLVALLGALAVTPRAGAADTAGAGANAIPKVELTTDSAKRSIDAYLELREKYGRKVPAAARAAAIDKTVKDAEGVRAIVSGKGFASVADWGGTIANVALAAGALGSDGNFDAKIAEIKGNKDIPPDLRERMISLLSSSRPSEANLKVVKGLAADPTYGPKLEQLKRKKAAAP